MNDIADILWDIGDYQSYDCEACNQQDLLLNAYCTEEVIHHAEYFFALWKQCWKLDHDPAITHLKEMIATMESWNNWPYEYFPLGNRSDNSPYVSIDHYLPGFLDKIEYLLSPEDDEVPSLGSEEFDEFFND